ncbi:two-component system, OmpR family, sensor histidine kinase TctE [Methylomagnum ishizawai]|uniref:histidine kinase n=1 Tax=Methylomagnum ishizawai TaxID=1760988 RepID=A0A1Y6D9K2_9GAMM|nr:sensor histidine kinase [Methylomagnum ishizawai]SMF97373.1 two-component system, OmpR family, sensor histidine kinase TctE [Methylomagnum ishizawai]
MRKPQSLRKQLLLRLTLPLTLVVVLDTAVSYFVALHYTNQAYDRWLLDSARSLAQEVKTYKNKVTFELPPIAVEVFRWDDTDKTYFKVESEATGFMAGDRELPGPKPAALDKAQPSFSDGEFQGRPVRVVSVVTEPTETSGEVWVSVAETLRKRQSMMEEILLAVVLPQVLLVLVTGLHFWTGINRGLKPLRDLAGMIARRSPKELSPIPDSGVPLEVRSLTRTINELLRQLAEAMGAQRRFIENAAHQLRTPLAGLKVQAERALRADDLEDMRPALGRIKNAADRASHLTTQLLVLARSEPGMDATHPFVPVDLCQLARETCMDWVPKVLDRGMDLGFEPPDAPPPVVRGDPTLLRELLNNLIDNAVCYGPERGQIVVSVGNGPSPSLAVEDGGTGIPDMERERVFERFYRIPGSPGEGCGLGLAIVREIAELHAARIGIGTGPGQRGTRFEVVFDREAGG